MRIRIRRELAGILNGVELSHFEPGLCYDVSDSLGGYLLSTGDAEEVFNGPEIIPPAEATDMPLFGGISVAPPMDRAADAVRRQPPPRGRNRR